MHNIKDYVSSKVFSEVKEAFLLNHAMELGVSDLDGNRIESFCAKECDPKFCRQIQSSNIGKGRCRQDRIRALNLAIETGEPYIAVCHAGIVMVCSPIMDGEIPLGGLFFGKCLWEKPNESLLKDVRMRLDGVVADKEKLIKSLYQLNVINGRKIHEAAQFLYILFYQQSGLDPRVVQWRRERSYQQGQICEIIAENKSTVVAGSSNFYQHEQQLMNKVRIGDKIGARDTLNMMLASVMLGRPGDLGVLKARMLELSTLLSRAAAEGGVDVSILLEKNLENINILIKINSQQDLCTWIGRAVDEFIEMVYSKQDSQKITQIKPALEFIDENYDQQIALADISRAAHLSVSRLAHVFKEQMGITVVDYLTSVRIEKAKYLLIATDKSCTEVCYEVGYNNQSYFTRIFKELSGLTPRQYRVSNRRD